MIRYGRVVLYPSLLLLALAAVFSAPRIFAAPAAPTEHTLRQADGWEFKARQWGDEWSHGWETLDGYSIAFDEASRNWAFAVNDSSGQLVASGMIVGATLPPTTWPISLRPTGAARSAAIELKASAGPAAIPAKVVAPTGAANIPVILVNFNNTATTYSAGQFDTLLFGTGNNSMKDYYEEVSYGAFTVSAGPGGVVGWYTAANTHNYYGTNSAGFDAFPGTLVREAVAAADAAGFNFAPYDQNGDCVVDVVNIVHQGTGEEAGGPSTDIWSHRWTLSAAFSAGRSSGGAYVTNDPCPAGGNIVVNDYVIQPEVLALDGQMHTMGVFAHEYGHALGLPDLYDTDNSSEGIGNWSLMAGGSWTRVSRSGDRPAHMDAWSKFDLGWVNPKRVLGLLPSESITDAAVAPDIYQMRPGTSMSGEYYLVENRNRAGFDAGLPGPGLLIWHIDGGKVASLRGLNDVNTQECYPGGPSCASQHYGVAVVQADNLWELEKGIDRGDANDPFKSPGNSSFTSATAPSSNLYNGSASNVNVTSIGTVGTTMKATLSVPGALVTGDFNNNGTDDVAGLSSSGQIWYSTNLSTWGNVPGTLTTLLSANFTPGGAAGLVGLTNTGQIFYTTNLTTWNQIPGTLAMIDTGDLNNDGVDDVIGLTAAGEVFYTTNLSTWTKIPGKLDAFKIIDVNNDGNEDIVGLVTGGFVFYTTNLSTWTPVAGTLASIEVGDLNGDGNGDIVGLTASGDIYFTTNLSTWTQIPGKLASIRTANLNNVGTGDLVGLTHTGQVFYTTNLSSWTQIPGKLTALDIGDVNNDNSEDIVGLTNAGQVFYTTNLSTWTQIPGTL